MKIIKCSCKNEWMDNEYGKGMRPHNDLQKEDHYRCIVCANVTSYSEVKKPKGKK